VPLNISTLIKSVQSNITALPQATTANIFVVSGDVFVTSILGVCTVVMGSVANATKLSAKCGALTAVDLCATADINALAAGTLFAPLTTFGTAASIAATNGVLINVSITAPGIGFLMGCGTTGAGIILVNCAGSGVTGAIRWSCAYMPLSSGASIVSA
jgi:hypothetical protein